MHPQLEKLLEIQDLKAQRSELFEHSAGRAVEEELFNISVEDAVQQLDTKIAEMEESLDGLVRSRYQRVSKSRTRFIVPVLNGTCFGCFVSVPTAVASERNRELRYCDHCGAAGRRGVVDALDRARSEDGAQRGGGGRPRDVGS
jgi:predicted  nucleic acid-binding Zn-ribbon protein